MEKEDLVDKSLQKIDKLDISRDEDLSIGVMNLISLEEHLYFSMMKTSNKKYLDMMEEIRKIRTDMMENLLGETEAEEWCISKHLLAASMRLIETGNKLKENNNLKYEETYERAFELYSLFWQIKLSGKEGFKDEINEPIREKNNEEDMEIKKYEKEDNLMEKAKAFVKKAVDCCIET